MGNNTDISGYVGLGIGIIAAGTILNMVKNIGKPHPQKDPKKRLRKEGYYRL